MVRPLCTRQIDTICCTLPSALLLCHGARYATISMMHYLTKGDTMAEPLAVERRVKVSVTVSPVLLREVDRFVAEHSGTDRSKVFNEALRLWHDQQLEEAIAAQHRAP